MRARFDGGVMLVSLVAKGTQRPAVNFPCGVRDNAKLRSAIIFRSKMLKGLMHE
jgi:hypothetical protein